MDNRMTTLLNEVRQELTDDILPFWMEKMTDSGRGGFYGRIDGGDTLHADAPKGAILNARILWTFSAAYRILRRPEYLDTATRAKRYIIDRFYDNDFGGVYWSLDADGNPLDTKKQIYAQGFAIYGLSEYARATGDDEALDYAIRLFCLIEEHSFDRGRNGYVEAFMRDWSVIGDMRLSDKDENASKTMNTHLHILEPYANLYRVWKDARLERQLRNMIGLFTDKIMNRETSHLDLFFDDDWHTRGDIVSYGHDIEASWLIHEAALVLGDKALLKEIEPVIVNIARAADEGLNPDGSMIYETFVAKELVDFVDSRYPTVPDRRHRAITGLSMGGHGALYLAIRHQDTFGAAGSMSGGVDFRPFPDNWDIKKRLGEKSEYPENWDRNTVMAQLPLLKPGALSMVFDCGTEDFFYEVNCNLHDEMARLKIPHEFTTRPGAHNWDYWRRSLRDHLLFFSDFFKETGTHDK